MSLRQRTSATSVITIAGVILLGMAIPPTAASTSTSTAQAQPDTAPSSQPSPTASPELAPNGATITVATADELTAALSAVEPGQTITLKDGVYASDQFEASADGTESAPITLTGSRDAILTTGDAASGYGLHITGDHWKVLGLSVSNSGKGIVLDGSNHTLISGVDVGNTGTEGVHFRAGSSNGVLENSVIHDTGTVTPDYGEEVYLGSAKSNWKKIMGSAGEMDRADGNVVRNNEISNTSAEGIDIKEGTTGGVVAGNVFTNAGHSGANYGDSWVGVKGNGYTITGNSGSGTKKDAFQVHSQLDGWGTDNTFTDNIVYGDVPGYEVWVELPSLGTVVDSEASGADSGVTNIPAE